MNRPLQQSSQEIPKRLQEWPVRRNLSPSPSGVIADVNTSSKVLINSLLGRPTGHMLIEEYRNSVPGKSLMADPYLIEYLDDNRD